MNAFAASLLIVATVVVAQVAYRAQFNFFTFVLGFGTLVVAGLTFTGVMP